MGTLDVTDGRQQYDEYQDSGVVWLGEIPSHWETGPLKYFVSIDPEALTEKTDDDFELRYVDISSVNSQGDIEEPDEFRFGDAPSRARKVVQHGDTIISTVRTYLKAIAFIDNPPENLIVSTGFAVLRPLDDVDERFLGYLISSKQFIDSAVSNSEGIGYPSISTSKLGRLPVWVPPLDEQRVIADYLDRETDRIDALIEKKEQLIDLLEEKRTALISRVVTQGLDGDAEMQDSGVEWLGEIPAHWDTVKLKWNTDKIGSGVTPDGGSEAYVDDGITFMRSQNVHFDGLRLDDVAFIDEETDREMESTRVYPRDVLLNITGASIGRCTIVPEDFPRANVNQHVCIIRAQQDELHPSYLNHVMASSAGQDQIFAEIDGASRDAVTFAEIGNFIVPKPPKEEQDRIAEYIERSMSQIYALIDQIEEGIELLEEYRTALISAAVTGQIDVREDARKPEMKEADT
ncbi:type I restriction enzyme S subunit [Salinibacter ruber]|nr:type I restriction enzyme S subunit [Salinibacter ruber]